MSSTSDSVEVRAPQDQAEGTRSQILRWLRAAGDAVTEHEPLIEVETDKVTIEIAAPASGVLREILKQEQEEINPGDVLARIQIGRDSLSTPAAVPLAAAGERPAPASSPAAMPPAVTAPAPLRTRARDRAAHGVSQVSRSVSPAVRRLLEERGLTEHDLTGTGPGGRISVDDVLRVQAVPPAVTIPSRHVTHSATRRRIAARMVESLLQVSPHVTTVFEADFASILAHRARHRSQYEAQGASLTLTAYVLAACVDAIRAVPEVNARWHEDSLEIFDSIDIGVGTAVEGKGLIVPVVRAVQTLSLKDIALELARLVKAAREERLTPGDVRGGTFTISNHGVSGSLLAAPIVINQPQVAILGVGKLEKRVTVLEQSGEDKIIVRPRCYLSLTIDHRALDGDRANRFLQVMVERLEGWPLQT